MVLLLYGVHIFCFHAECSIFGSISATALAPLQLGSLPYIINILMIIIFFVVLLPPPFPKVDYVLDVPYQVSYIQGVPKKIIQVLRFFSVLSVPKVWVTDFPENFTRGTPWPKEFEVRRIFNLSAQNGH